MPNNANKSEEDKKGAVARKRDAAAPRATSPAVTLTCDQIGCPFVCSKNSILKQHRTAAHGLDSASHRCTIPGCDYKAKIGGHLKRHMANLHDVDVVWYSCDQEGCSFKTKEASNLRCHRKRVHQITWTPMRTHTPKVKADGAVVSSSSSSSSSSAAAAAAHTLAAPMPAVHVAAPVVSMKPHPAGDAAPKPQPPKVTL